MAKKRPQGDSSSTDTRTLEPWQRGFATVLGVGLVSAGVLAVFVTDNEVGSAILLVAGGLFLLIGVVGLVPDTLRIGDNELQWQRRAQELREDGLSASASASTAAGPQAVLARLQELEIGYQYVRSSLPKGGQRTVALEEVLLKARNIAPAVPETALRARLDGFNTASDGARAVTLGLLEATRPADPDSIVYALVACLESARSAFEQYHAILAARESASSLSPGARAQLSAGVETYLARTPEPSGDRAQLAREVLRRL